MTKLQAYLVLAILLLVSGCSCDCTTVDTTMPTKYLNTESQLVVFADACAQSDGSVDDEVPAVPNGTCTGTNGYQNRGRWVKSPNTGVSPGSSLSIAVTGSIYYCSTGIDNLNPTPNFVISPAQPKKNTMTDGSQLPVVAGQTIVVNVTNMSPDPGVTISSTPACTNTTQTCTTTSTTPNSSGNDSSQTICTTTAECNAYGQNCGTASSPQCIVTSAHYPCTYGPPSCTSSSSTTYTTTNTCNINSAGTAGYNSNCSSTYKNVQNTNRTTQECDANGQNCGPITSSTLYHCCSDPSCPASTTCSWTKTKTVTTITPNSGGTDSSESICTSQASCNSNPLSCGSFSSPECSVNAHYPCASGVCIPTSSSNCSVAACPVPVVPSNACTTYNGLLAGTCAGTLGFGLTTYIGDTEFSTLDNTDAPNSYLPLAQFRNSYLFADIPPNEISDIYSNTAYPIAPGTGYGQYVFVVPDNLKGLLGFSIARGTGASGTGNYTLQVMSTPPACYVNQAFAGGQPDQRGALEVLVSQTNPNDVDTIVADFNALNNGNEISIYYPQLNQYIASFNGVSIASNAAILASLVVTDDPSLSPMTMTTSSYSGFATSTGDIWYKIRDDYYNDNVGNYTITTNVSTVVNTQAAEFLNDLITPITSALTSASAVIYQSFTYSHFLNIARLCLLLHMMIYGAEFALGLTAISVKDALIRIIKIAVVIELFSTDSWGFFNNYFFNLFTTGRDFLIATVTGDPTTNKIGVFGFVDDIFNTFFAKATWVKIAALMPDGIGIAFLMILVFIMAYYLMTLAKVIVAYLMINVGIALLIALAPMFFVMILFEKTRKFFDGWLKHLVDYALQPVIMFGALYIMDIVFLEMWNAAMDFDVCFGGDIFDIYVPLSIWSEGLIPNVSLGCIQTYRTNSSIDYFSMVIQLFSLIVMTFVIGAMVEHIPTITSAITGAQSAAAISGAAEGAVNKGMDLATKGVENIGSAAKAGANAASNLARSAYASRSPAASGNSGGQGGVSGNNIQVNANPASSSKAAESTSRSSIRGGDASERPSKNAMKREARKEQKKENAELGKAKKSPPTPPDSKARSTIEGERSI